MFAKHQRRIVFSVFIVWLLVFAYQVGWSSHHPLPGHGIEIYGLKLGEALLVFVTAWLALVTRDLVTGADEAGRQQQRAYLAAEPRGITFPSGVIHLSERMLGHISIHNVGHGPARKVSWKIFMEVGPKSRTHFAPPTVAETTRTIQPQAEMLAGSSNMIDGKNAPVGEYLFVWGRIEYEDQFGAGHFTNFCHRYPVGRVVKDNAGYVQYSRHHEYGNEAD